MIHAIESSSSCSHIIVLGLLCDHLSVEYIVAVGYRCCSLSDASTYECNTNYTQSWELVWYGPVALLLWVYTIAFIHFYKLYRHAFVQAKIRQLSGFSDTIDDIKQDIINRVVKISKKLARVTEIDDLISLREECGFLDVLGVDRASQSKITNVSKVIVVVLLFSAYYVVYALFLYEYRLQVKRHNKTICTCIVIIIHH